ncbi:MAG TPA: hypothetical protein PK735_13260, partial [Flavobacteriales bacterium]|nr:hypothetical protein [Flavobacteriales bacterium]
SKGNFRWFHLGQSHSFFFRYLEGLELQAVKLVATSMMATILRISELGLGMFISVPKITDTH